MMKFWFVISVFFLGIVIGFYIAVYSTKQIAVLGATGVIIAVFSGAAVVNTSMNMLLQWSREPKLKFGRPSPNAETVYHLRVTKIWGKGSVGNCTAFLTVDNTIVTDSPTIWSLYAKRVVDIGDVDVYARLFRVENGKSIYFPVAKEHQGIEFENCYPLEQVIDKMITVRMVSTIGSVPTPFVDSIRNIIDSRISWGEG